VDVEIRLLREDDVREGFSCGEPALDRFFQHYAAQNQFKLHLAVTWVAVVDKRILGFATVTAGVIERSVVPSAKARKRLPAYPLPVLRLARLGVDQKAQGLGLGRALLRHVLQLALAQRDSLGCLGVVTDAKEHASSFYASLGFVELEGVREGALHGDTTPMFLSIDVIAKALQS
jgi:GNAT superfamily N-acetyltransferase